MRHRPKRENYPRGTYGDIDYQERLERYCTYLENRNKALTEQCNIADVVGRSEQLRAFSKWYEKKYRFEITEGAIKEFESLGS